MIDSDWPADGKHRRFLASRRTAGVVTIGLVATVAFGAVDQYLGAIHSSFLTQVSGMSAPWLLVSFLAGASQPSRRRAMTVGLAAVWLAVLGYVVMIIGPMEGTHLGPRPAGLVGSWNKFSLHLFVTTLASQWLWFAGGLMARNPRRPGIRQHLRRRLAELPSGHDCRDCRLAHAHWRCHQHHSAFPTN